MKGGNSLADKEKPTFNKAAYDRQYMADKVTKFTLYLNREKDSDVIDCLNQQKSKSSFIKKLIRKHLSEDQ